MKKKAIKSEQPKQAGKSFLEFPRKDNQNLPHIWIDHLVYSQRSDGISMLQFYSQLPDFSVEQVRLQTTTNTVIKIIDVLTRTTGYYPTKPKK